MAYDSATGERLWSAPAGGTVRSAPSTVMADGKQYIVVASGNVATSVGATGFTGYSSVPRSRSRPRLLAFALDGSAPAPPWAEIPHIPAPPAPRLDATLASAGEGLFEAYGCDACHGHAGVAVWETLDLRVRPPANVEYLQTVLDGALTSRGMPAIELGDEGVEAPAGIPDQSRLGRARGAGRRCGDREDALRDTRPGMAPGKSPRKRKQEP